MVWPTGSPDLTLIENRRAIVKKKIYVGQSVTGSLRIVKTDLWDARYSNSVYKDVNFKDIESLINSVDKRVTLVSEKKGGHIAMQIF